MTVSSMRHLDNIKMSYVVAYFAGTDVDSVKYLWHSMHPAEGLPEYIFPSRQEYEHSREVKEHRGVWLVALTTTEFAEKAVLAAYDSHMPPRRKVGEVPLSYVISWAKIGWGWSIIPSSLPLGEALEKFEDYTLENMAPLETMLGLLNIEDRVIPDSSNMEPVYEHALLMKVADSMGNVLKNFVEH